MTDRTAEDVIADLRQNTDVWDILDLGDERLLLAHIDALRAENDKLRALLAKGSGDCAYCGLPADDIAKCASGFPGCARMDDIMANAKAAELHDIRLKLAAEISVADALRAERDAAYAALRTIERECQSRKLVLGQWSDHAGAIVRALASGKTEK